MFRPHLPDLHGLMMAALCSRNVQLLLILLWWRSTSKLLRIWCNVTTFLLWLSVEYDGPCVIITSCRYVTPYSLVDQVPANIYSSTMKMQAVQVACYNTSCSHFLCQLRAGRPFFGSGKRLRFFSQAFKKESIPFIFNDESTGSCMSSARLIHVTR
jgi:hypothetical protein